MNRLLCAPLAAWLILAAAPGAEGQTSYPMLMSLKPAAAEAGASTEHVVSSRYSLYDAYEVLVAGTGVRAEILHPERKPEDAAKPPNLQELRIRFTVDADALPGVRDFRIATPRGVSTLGQLVIGTQPVVSEGDSNDLLDAATPVALPATVCGAIEKAEDVDFYRFSTEAGQQLNFHVWSMRLQDRIHDLQQHADPIITLRNAAGSTVAASDNVFSGDPSLSYQVEQPGDYYLEVRDVRYQGNKYWEYAIEISDGPLVTRVHPLGVPADTETPVALIGRHLPEPGTGTVDAVTAAAADGSGVIRTRVRRDGTPLGTVSVVASPLPLVAEGDAANDAPEAAQAIALPAGINGRIEQPADIDCYAFEAKQGQRLSFEVIARRCDSQLDSHLRVLNAEGRQFQLNDDLRLGLRTQPDSWIEDWTVPADGRYVVEVRDLHLRGGDAFPYFLKITESTPTFELYVDTDKTQLTPTTDGVFYVRAVRKNGFAGEIQLAVEGLPPGVTAACGRILADGRDGCIVLTADAAAPLSVDNIRVLGTATVGEGDAARTLTAAAVAYQEIYQPGGGRGHWPSSMHTVSVNHEADVLAVTVKPTEIQLQPGESQRLEISIERAAGFTANVTLDAVVKHLNQVYGDSLPKGVTIDSNASKTLLTGGATQGHLTLTAAADAPPVASQQIAVMANVSINFVMKATYSSEPISITVLEK